MIVRAVEELTPIVGTRRACAALGVAPATIHRRRRPPASRVRQPRPQPARALTAEEREAVHDVLTSERFVDRAPAQVWATLLVEGTYLCSERSMYRVLSHWPSASSWLPFLWCLVRAVPWTVSHDT